MSKSFPPARVALAALVITTAGVSGCSMFGGGDGVFDLPPEQRPLEVPPAFDPSRVESNTASGGSATASGATAAAAATQGAPGFTVAGTRDEVFARVGQALGGVDGVVVNSRAQLLGVYDVAYGGANVLVRVSEGANGVTVSVVDPRGVGATGDAARRLAEVLRPALGG